MGDDDSQCARHRRVSVRRGCQLNICLGFLRPDTGSVSINGVDAISAPESSRRLVGYVPEQVLLYEALTGLEHIQFFTSLSGVAMGKDTALDALSRAGLDTEAAHRRVGVYSKGMRQKVALAIALAKRASTLLLDEPLSGLDPKSAIDLSERLRMFSREGRAVLLTTHDLFRALETATHVGIMRGGEIRHTASTQGLCYEELEQRYLDIMSDH